VHGEREAAHHISIGRFAGLTGISADKLLRYNEAGLLSPAFADPLTGYRLRSIEQLDDGILMRLMRDLDVPLHEVKSLMVAGGPDGVRAALAHHRERIVERHVELECIRARIFAAVEEARGLLRYELELIKLRPQWVVSCRTTARPTTPRRVTW
jgi:DNA-binding transcriptional MerR regulator